MAATPINAQVSKNLLEELVLILVSRRAVVLTASRPDGWKYALSSPVQAAITARAHVNRRRNRAIRGQ
jgi:hypothetical protein